MSKLSFITHSFTFLTLLVGGSAFAQTGTTTTLSPSTPGPEITGSLVTYTASVSASGSPVTAGTVTFTDALPGAITATPCATVPVSNGQATCSATINAEGNHQITATYNPSSSFLGSFGFVDEVYRHATSNPSGTMFCNTGSITIPGVPGNQPIYPSYINVTGVTPRVANISVSLNGLQFPANGLSPVHMLLVSPSGQAYQFLSGAGSGTTAESPQNFTFTDGSGSVPATGPVSAGTYGGSVYTANDLYPAPAPASFTYAPPSGTAFFESTFQGSTSDGNWLLYILDNGGAGLAASVNSGWCVNITPAIGTPTTTTLASSATPLAALGAAVTFTATVTASPDPNEGTVTFVENGNPLTGAPNSGVVNVSNGVASISTTGLPEGDHVIIGEFHDPSNSFSPSYGTVTIRIDKATNTPTLNGNTWTYCNSGGISIPASTLSFNDVGRAGPNPSNVMVTNLPGTISTATLTLNSFKVTQFSDLQSLLVGPNGPSAPTAAQTLDFFTNNGSASGMSAQTTTFTDSGSGIATGAPAPSQKPESFGSAPSYFASPFFPLPGSFDRAASAGSSTFASAFANSNPNGVWSLYFDQTAHNSNGDGASGWCMNFIENAVTGAGTTSHVGPAPSNHMIQGGTGSVTFSLFNNGPGSTGDPDQAVAHAMTVTGTLPAGLTLGTVPTGSPWNCTADSTTQLTCTNLNAIADASTYGLLTIPVNVASSAGTSVVVSGFTFSGAGMTAGTFASDTIIINAPALLSVSKTTGGTFTQGSTGQWNISVSNISTGATDGSLVTLRDPLPTGFSVTSVITGNEWNCNSTTQTVVLCTTNNVLAGADASYQTITVNVSIPPNSPISVTNTASAWGGGDVTHNSQSNAATGFSTVTVVQTPATINLTAGNNQSAPVNTAFATNLSVTVLDAGGIAINNATVTFTAPASGASGTFAGGTNVKTAVTNTSGVATATTYTANGTGGAYSVGVSASPVSNNFSLTNNVGPVVTANPVSQSIASGSNVTFTAAASGVPTPTVQWQVSTDGGGSFVNVGGAVSTSLSFTTLTAQNGNQYRAVFTNSGGTATTTAATLTVTTGPVITTNPTNATVNAGSNANFTAAASGTPTPTVQWQVSTDGGSTFSNLGGATTTTLTLLNVTAAQNGNKYRAVFTNSTGSATTTAATLTVNVGPTVTTNPISQSITAGSNVTFTAAASGSPAPTVQWQVSTDGGSSFTNVGGATSTTLQLIGVPASSNGYQYHAVFTNTVGSVTTTAATLTVAPVVIPATVTNVTSTTADGTYGAGAVIPVVVSFSKSVFVTGTPMLALNSSGLASYSSGSGTSSLTFIYNVAAGQSSARLDEVSSTALKLNGGSILDSTALAATLTLPAPGAAGSLGANKNIVIQTTGPTVVSFNVMWGSTSYNVIGSLRNRLPWQIIGIQVVFSEPITSGDVNSLVGVSATGLSGLGTTTLTWTIPKTPDGALALSLAGAGADALKDAAGNPLGSGSGFTQNLKILYGDFDDDGVVTILDQTAVLAATRSAYNILADMNGDGLVSTADVVLVRSQIGNTLP